MEEHSIRLRRLTLRTLDKPRSAVNVYPATGRGSGPHKEKFHSYLGVVAREKIPIVHSNWINVPESLKKLVKFYIPKTANAKKKLTTKFVYANNEGQDKEGPSVKYGIDPQTWEEFAATRKTPNWQGIWKRAQEIQKHNDYPHLLSRGGYDLLKKKLQQEAMLTENMPQIDDLPSPIERHDSLEEHMTQGSFVPQVHDDILNTAIRRSEHGVRVRVARSGVTISQYYGRTSRGSNTSSISISQQQLAEIIGSLKEEWRSEIIVNLKEEMRNEIEEENKRTLEKMKHELKEAIKIELSQRGSVYTPPIGVDITKGSNAENAIHASGEEHDANVISTIGLYVQGDNYTHLVAKGNIYDGGPTIHNVAYPDDVVRVSVLKIYDGDAEVPFPMSEIKYIRQALDTFIA
ncbi:hypothetical protein HKD37_17G047899 [Glycine soja]